MGLLKLQDKEVVPFFLDGKSVTSETTFPVVSASSGETIHHAQSASVDDGLAACASSGKAFQTWKRASITARRQLILKVAEIYQRDIDEFVRLQRIETSAEESWARSNVMGSVAYLNEIASRISGIQGAIPQNENPNALSFVFKEPVGPILCIPPWNAAMILATRAMATAIAAGCTVVLKCSELCPATHYKILEAFVEAGIPPGVLNSIQVRREDAAKVTEALIADRNIRKIEFIGSAAVGRIIGATAAKHLKPVLMELGGKCPAIVLDDADLEQAAQLCAKGALLHHGQICFSTERIIVHESIFPQFRDLLVQAFKSNHIPESTAVTKSIAQHATEVLEDAQSKGLEFLTGGPDPINSTSLRPSIVLNPTEDARIYDEETFGPSASLYTIPSDQAAISLANASNYGLNATIHTRNLDRGLRMARELEYGQVHINSISVYVSPTGPQGGVKGSGWGRQNGGWGFEQFLVEKFVSWRGSMNE